MAYRPTTDRFARAVRRSAAAVVVLVALVAVSGLALTAVPAAPAASPAAQPTVGGSSDVSAAHAATDLVDAEAADHLGVVAGARDDDATTDSANESANGSTPTELSPIDPANATGADDAPIELHGEGQTVTDPVALDDGLLVVSYAHDGDSNVQMWLWNESSDERETLLVNEIGTIEGATAAPISAGNYSLEVVADGNWNVTLVQPNATAVLEARANATANGTGASGTANETNGTESDGPETNDTEPTNATNATSVTDAPAIASGNGSAVLGPVRFEDSVIVTGNYTGESNFQVWLWAENGTSQLDGALVFNELGQVDGAERRVSQSGVSWIVVDTVGEWELQFG